MALSRTRRSTTSRAGAVLAALGILALLAGCGGSESKLLTDRVCDEADLPGGFERLTFGNLSRSDLGREVGAASLEAAGIEGGYFAYWKERRDSLKDDPAIEIVCQVVAFGGDGEASQFVADLPAEADWLSVTVAGIALAEGTTLVEVAAGDEEGARAFRLDEPDGRVRYGVVAARDRFVLSVHLGGPEGEVSVGEAVEILAAMGR